MASYEQNKSSKLWSVRFRVIESGIEKNKRLSGYKTKKEACAGYVDFMNDFIQRQELVANGNKNEHLTFGQLYNEFKNYYKTRVKDSTYYDFCNKSELHILPTFKDKALSEIKSIDVLKWQNSIDHYSHQYKCNLRALLSIVLKYAERYYDIPNIMLRVESFRNTTAKPEMLFWSVDEFQRFITVVDRFDYKALFIFLFFTGCRRGEALALSWSDINFKNKTVSFNKSLTSKVPNRTWAITTPKNDSSVRTISLPLNIIDILSKYKKWQELNLDSGDFVFGGCYPLSESSVTRYFANYCALSGVKKIRLHDFRHSHASYLISRGASIVAVAKRLGHSNIEQTLNTYAHLMPKEDQFLISALNEIEF